MCGACVDRSARRRVGGMYLNALVVAHHPELVVVRDPTPLACHLSFDLTFDSTDDHRNEKNESTSEG